MDLNDEKWIVSHHNKKKIYLTFDNLFSLKYGNNYNKIININDNFLESKFLLTLEKQHYLINIQENHYYQSMSETELKDNMSNILNKEINIKNYNRILFKENLTYQNCKEFISGLKLEYNNYIYSFKLINYMKKLSGLIFKINDNSQNKYIVITYFEDMKYRLILLNNYLDLLLYLYKLEIDMKCNPRYTKLLINYPYKFRELNHNHIRNYFNSFQIFWKY